MEQLAMWQWTPARSRVLFKYMGAIQACMRGWPKRRWNLEVEQALVDLSIDLAMGGNKIPPFDPIRPVVEQYFNSLLALTERAKPIRVSSGLRAPMS